jgi:hypothetical protein
MNRAVGAHPGFLLHFSWGVAPGWYERTPLASPEEYPKLLHPAEAPLKRGVNESLVGPSTFSRLQLASFHTLLRWPRAAVCVSLQIIRLYLKRKVVVSVS